MENVYDTIVLGVGAAGSATVYQLAKRNNKVLGLDQFSPPHTYGSSHGGTRITRKAIGEGLEYTPITLRSYEIWREIEKETGMKLLQITGGLIMSSKSGKSYKANFFKSTVEAAKMYNIPHEILNATEIRRRFPQFIVKDDEVGYYEYDAGFLRPEECIKANLMLAKKYGAQIHLNEKVTNFEERNGLVYVNTNRNNYVAKKLIVSAGAWLPGFFRDEFKHIFAVCRQVMYWFDVKNGEIENYLPGKFPIFIWELPVNSNGLYGFPSIDGPYGGVKVASHQFKITSTPDSMEREVTEDEIKEMYSTYVKPYFSNLTEKCVKAVSCLYTMTPDKGFIIDKHPNYNNIILASPCSGHGFKHSAAIGEILAQLATQGKTTLDISKFSISRFCKYSYFIL